MTPTTWRAGDRVLAPWEAAWLYPGTIKSLRGQGAFIEFDDGDMSEIPVASLMKLELAVGQRVQGRWKQGPKEYAPAMVTHVDGTRIQVRYDDGRTETTTISFLRIPRPAPPQAVVARSAVWRAGDRVLGPWEPGWYYPATIRCVDDDTIFLRFDDGDKALVPADLLLPLRLEIGQRVFARWDKGPRLYYPARITAVRGEELQLAYDDGRTEHTTVSFIRVDVGGTGKPS